MSDFVRGSIVWSAIRGPDGWMILDENGQPKRRPVIILTPTSEINPAAIVQVAAISTQFDLANIPSHWHLMPSQPGGDRVTGLDKPCVAKSDWLARVDLSEIDFSLHRSGRRAPSSIVRKILNWLADKDREHS